MKKSNKKTSNDSIMKKKRKWNQQQKNDTENISTGNNKKKKHMKTKGIVKKQYENPKNNNNNGKVENVVPSTTTTTTTLSNTNFPLTFPKNIKVPKNGFLRNEEPYKEAFDMALKTSYEGFQTDIPLKVSSSSDDDDNNGDSIIRKALLKMEQANFFRTDVTQPFGLGTKCAKTYVTRCLLGEPGTTYKYLGLRMFSHPWKLSTATHHNHKNSSTNTTQEDEEDEIKDAMRIMLELNQTLERRTLQHLKDLNNKRKQRAAPLTRGRNIFNITLINRMIYEQDLKKEPTYGGQERCTVSWHADSSLEHYSSIAVYHHFFPSHNNNNNNHDGNIDNDSQKIEDHSKRWSIALRVAHNSEGPTASSSRHREVATDTNINHKEETPSIAVTLPPGSAYYLLDDFNHHHQHAVLVNHNNSSSVESGVRFASTHRLLREGHTVQFILERCKNACSQFHKKGHKLWRSEQLLLTEIESEWIRQFFIQGQSHKQLLWKVGFISTNKNVSSMKDLLYIILQFYVYQFDQCIFIISFFLTSHKYWEEPICALLQYWSRLEARTKQVIDLLQGAAEAVIYAKNTTTSPSSNEIPSRLERKKREKMKKSESIVKELLNRSTDENEASSLLYEPYAQLLEERATIRQLWQKRESDVVFQRMNQDCRPIPVPFQYESGSTSDDRNNEVGKSPLVGTPEGLKQIAAQLRQYGQSFHTGKPIIMDDTSESLSKTNVRCDKDDIHVVVQSTVGVDNNKHEKISSPSPNSNKDVTNFNSIINDTNNTILPIKQRNVTIETDKHTKSLTWDGWSSPNTFGLEMQHPWAGLLLQGKKTIETRNYNLPKKLIGEKIYILETKSGIDGVSALPDSIEQESDVEKHIKCAGWCVFDKVVIYRYKSKFEMDVDKHLVTPDSGYGWKNGGDIRYGWVVKEYQRLPNNIVKKITRRMRSLYEVELNFTSINHLSKQNKKKKKPNK